MEPGTMDRWPHVTVMGAGAVGCYFGGMLARAGAPVTLIGRRAHVEAMARDGLFMESVHFRGRVSVAASTQPDAVRGAELVLFSVKTTDTEEAARLIAPHLDSGGMVVSLQNGVDNVERIRAATGIRALPAVVYVAAAMAAPGHVKHSGRGDLVVGPAAGQPDPSPQKQAAERVAQVCSAAGVPCRVSDQIETELWTKLIWNCAGNAITALARASYRQVARHELGRQLAAAVAQEAMAVGRAAGVALPQIDFVAVALKLAESLGDATSSTAQDIERGKRTEMDSLNGYVVRRGAELGVPTPTNNALYALVKLLEDSRMS